MLRSAGGLSILVLTSAFWMTGMAASAESPTEQIRSRDMPAPVPPSSNVGSVFTPPADLDLRRSGFPSPASPSTERDFRERREQEAERARERHEEKRESRERPSE